MLRIQIHQNSHKNRRMIQTCGLTGDGIHWVYIIRPFLLEQVWNANWSHSAGMQLWTIVKKWWQNDGLRKTNFTGAQTEIFVWSERKMNHTQMLQTLNLRTPISRMTSSKLTRSVFSPLFFENNIRELFQNLQKVLPQIWLDTDAMDNTHLHDFVGTASHKFVASQFTRFTTFRFQ